MPDKLDRLANFPRGVNRYFAPALDALGPLRQALGLPRVEVIPDSANIAVAGNSTYEHRVSVPVGSFLWALSGSTGQSEGFRVQIVDTATDKSLLSQPAIFGAVTGQGLPAGVKNCLGTAVSIVQRLGVLPKPRVVIEPGVLKVQVTNLSASPNSLQLVLWFFTPPQLGEPRNEFNGILDAEAELCRRAIRGQAIVTDANGQQIITAQGSDPMSQPAMNAPFTASVVGDNIIIPGASGYRIGIHQLSLYSTAAQNVRLLDGGVDVMGALTDFAAGYFLPYQPEPHFVLSDGLPFAINIAAGNSGATGSVTGFVKYRMFERWPL